MREEAIVEIFGRLATNVVIKKLPDGRQYGETIIALNKSSPGNVAMLNKPLQQIHFPVFIWNQELLEQEVSILSKGQSVLLIGELELLDRTYISNSIDIYPQDTVPVVSLKRNRSISSMALTNSTLLK